VSKQSEGISLIIGIVGAMFFLFVPTMSFFEPRFYFQDNFNILINIIFILQGALALVYCVIEMEFGLTATGMIVLILSITFWIPFYLESDSFLRPGPGTYLAIIGSLICVLAPIVRDQLRQPETNINDIENMFYTVKQAKVVVYCTQCGTKNEASHIFCQECGNKLE